MSIQDEFKKLFEAQEDLAEKTKEHQKEVLEIFGKKINELCLVGRSVLVKSYGKRKFSREERVLPWIGNGSCLKVVSLKQGFFVVEPHSSLSWALLNNRESQKERYEIPVRYLSMSDRDFAREVRDAVNRHKMKVREQARLEGIEFAGSEIKKMEKEIKDKQRMIDRLKNELDKALAANKPDNAQKAQ